MIHTTSATAKAIFIGGLRLNTHRCVGSDRENAAWSISRVGPLRLGCRVVAESDRSALLAACPISSAFGPLKTRNIAFCLDLPTTAATPCLLYGCRKGRDPAPRKVATIQITASQ